MSYISFYATPAGSQRGHECSFHTLTTGIATRHSDTVDVKFMIGGRPIVIALPHDTFAQFKQTAKRPLTDREAIEAAGFVLKRLIEAGQWFGQDEHRPEAAETLQAIRHVTGT